MAESVVAELQLDISQYVSSMQKGVKANTELASASKRLEGTLDQLDAGFNKLGLGKIASETARLTTSFHTAQQSLSSVASGARSTSSALESLSSDMSKFRSEMNRASDSAAKFGRETSQSMESVKRATHGLHGGLLSLRNIIIGLGLGILAREAIQVTAAFNSVSRTLETVTGSAALGAEAFGFVRSEANRLGTDLLTGARAFASLTNSAKGTALEGENTRRIFTAFGEATTGLGLSTEKYQRIMLATGQVISKGKVYAEELLQFTEAGIPANKILGEAYREMGVDLHDAMRKGLVPAEALLLIANKIHEQFFQATIRNSETLEAKFRVLINTTQETVAWFGAAVFQSDALKQVVVDITTVIDGLRGKIGQEGIKVFTNETVGFAKTLWTLLEGIYRLLSNINTILDKFNKDPIKVVEGIDTASAAMPHLAEQTKGLLDPLREAAKWLFSFPGSAKELADSIQDSADKTGELAAKMSGELSPALQKLGSGIDVAGMSISISNAYKKGAKEGAEGAKKETKGFVEFAVGEIKKLQEELKRLATGKSEDELEKEAEKRRKFVIDALKKQLKDEETLETKALKKQVANIALVAEEEQVAYAEAEEREKKLTKSKFEQIDARTKAAIKGIEEERQASFTYIRFYNEEVEKEKKKLEEIETNRKEGMEALFTNAADNVTQILERVVEKDWIGTINEFFNFVGQAFSDAGKAANSPGLQAIGTAVQGIGAGVGTGFSVATLAKQAGAGGTTAGALGGAAGGAVAGFYIGSVVPVIGNIIGAVVGAIVGAVAGGLLASGQKPPTFARGVQTTATLPPEGQYTDSSFRRSPFGLLTIPEEGSRGIAGFRDLETVAKLDRAIAQFLNEQQKARVSQQLQGTITGEIKGEDFLSGSAEALGNRLAIIIGAAIGFQEGQNVRQRFEEINPRGDAESRAQLASEILGINKIITDALDTKQLTQFEQAAEELKKQFDELRPLALDYGFSLERINEAQAAALDKLREQVDTTIADQLLSLTDPFAANLKQLREEAALRLRDVRAVGGDVQAVLKLNAQLEKNLRQQQALDERQQAITRQAFFRDIQAQTIAITNEAAAAELQLQSARQQNIQQAMQFNATPAELASINALYNAQVNAARAAARQQAQLEAQRRRQEAAQRAAEARRAAQERARAAAAEIAERQRSRGEFLGASLGLTDPFKAALFQMQQDVARFAAFVNRGIISRAAFNQFAQLSRAATILGQSVNALSGRATPIDQLGNAFDQFIRAGKQTGSPIDQFREDMLALTKEFRGVSEAARIAGFNSDELKQSYLSQAETIRGRLKEAIDQQLSDQIQGIESVRSYLAERRVSENLPGNIRLEEAQAQFRVALRGDDSSEVIRASQQLDEIARQNFASGQGYFDISRMIEASLNNYANQQQRAVDNERARYEAAAAREIQMLAYNSNSLNTLRRMDTTAQTIYTGVRQLVDLAYVNGQQSAENTTQIRNLALIIGRQYRK